MKRILSRLKTDEKGQAMILALILLVVGALILAPLLGFMGSGLTAGQSYEAKMAEYYAADAGVEEGLWQLIFDGLVVPEGTPAALAPFTMNGKTVNVTIENIVGQPVHKITSTAGGTTIESYVTIAIGYAPGDFILGGGEEVEDVDVIVGGDIILGNGSEIEREDGEDLYVWASGDITLGAGAEIEGESGGNLYVCAGGDIILGDGAEIRAKDGGNVCVCAGGDIILGAGAEIQAQGGGSVNVYVPGDLILGAGAEIFGDVYVGGTVTLGAGAQIYGTVYPYQECSCAGCLAMFGIQEWKIL